MNPGQPAAAGLFPGDTPAPQRVLLGVCGSFGAWASPGLVMVLRHLWRAEVRVLMTRSAESFVTPATLAVATGQPVVCAGVTAGDDRNGRVEHLELARWADLVLVAPASANTLAAAAAGSAGNLLTTVLLAAGCPVAVAPSMNAAMWGKPAVQRNVRLLTRDGVAVVPPVTGPAAVDGVPGPGSMPPPAELAAWVQDWWAAGATAGARVSATVADRVDEHG